jgi:A/G-specific adenine glycosylase
MQIEISQIEYFQVEILDWYKINRRHFPWRNPSATNYEKIISEVLLQRTKAETVAKFFSAFIKKYPSWRQLGNATESELKEILKPLGLYNQRGSRLYKLAQELKKRNGRFPLNRDTVEEIPMMGQYITNAYELFVLNQPSPLLDVNMARVLERYFGPRKLADIRHDPYLQKLSLKVVNHHKSKEINWAILDYGAIICNKRNPSCQLCMFNKTCNYNRSNSTLI